LTRIEFFAGSTCTSSPAISPALMNLCSASFFSGTFDGASLGSSFFTGTFGGVLGSSFLPSAAKTGAISKADSGRNVQQSKRLIVHPSFQAASRREVPHPFSLSFPRGPYKQKIGRCTGLCTGCKATSGNSADAEVTQDVQRADDAD